MIFAGAKLIRAFKYRLYPNKNQERELSIALETHRRIYNTYLDYRELIYQCYHCYISYVDFSRWFTGQRKTNQYFSRINRSAATSTMRRLDKAYNKFFSERKNGTGLPKFQNINRFCSIEFPAYGKGIKLNVNKLYVQFVGNVRVKLHRPVEGEIKTTTLKKENEKWYVVFTCRLPDELVQTYLTSSVGIDVGLNKFITDSNGNIERNPKYLKASLTKLKRVSRSFSRKKRGGKNRQKVLRVLRNVHTRVKNQRREHHYQVAHRLVANHGFIVAESLNLQNMKGSRQLNRAIRDAAWGSFLTILKHKCEKAGVQFVQVDACGTSQNCYRCNNEVKKSLSVRWHDCPHCGLYIDRDLNAAKNILIAGLKVREELKETKKRV